MKCLGLEYSKVIQVLGLLILVPSGSFENRGEIPNLAFSAGDIAIETCFERKSQ